MSKTSNITALQHRQGDSLRSKGEMAYRSLQHTTPGSKLQHTLLSKNFKDLQVLARREGRFPDWKELDDLYQTIALGVYNFTMELGGQVRAAEEHMNALKEGSVYPIPAKQLEDYTHFMNASRTAIMDFTTISNTLLQIKAKHKDESGRLTDFDQMTGFYAIGGEYNEQYEAFQRTALAVGSESTSYAATVKDMQFVANAMKLSTEASPALAAPPETEVQPEQSTPPSEENNNG